LVSSVERNKGLGARVRKSRQKEAAGAADAVPMEIEWSEGEVLKPPSLALHPQNQQQQQNQEQQQNQNQEQNQGRLHRRLDTPVYTEDLTHPRQTKGPVSARPHLNRRATPRLYLKTPGTEVEPPICTDA
jgi:hypothetical protein